MNTPADHEAVTLCRADAAVVDRLVAGGAGVAGVGAERVERVERLLGLLGRWPVADPDPGLSARSVGAVLGAAPASISGGDGLALESLLALRRAGLEDGPMPAEVRARAQRVAGLLSLLDRMPDEPVPGGLVDRTMRAVERDRAEQRRRSAVRIGGPGETRSGGLNLRQMVTTAALLLMVLSVLFPMLEKGRRDALIARCGENLAGLGVDVQSFVLDHKGRVGGGRVGGGRVGEGLSGAGDSPAMFKQLSGFARRGLNGSEVPASRVRLFLLLDERRVGPEHLSCPASGPERAGGYYNGQNPIAGGPFRLFLQPRPIFADTNPLYRVTPTGLVRDEAVPALTRSANHDGAGQNVLVSDGSVRWTVRPAVFKQDGQEDNIWLFQKPADAGVEPDVFLTP